MCVLESQVPPVCIFAEQKLVGKFRSIIDDHKFGELVQYAQRAGCRCGCAGMCTLEVRALMDIGVPVFYQSMHAGMSVVHPPARMTWP